MKPGEKKSLTGWRRLRRLRRWRELMMLERLRRDEAVDAEYEAQGNNCDND